ncbi:MAG: D-2-hydroxyacid dehydrogenase family protein, partial [Nitrospinae bacterium]|nr:D-2-hydroxyacid dehydrogenase family protein [Nitrospinota bacterium]
EIGNLAEGGWQTTLGEDLYGKTLGVYSYGNIGSQVAAVGKAFGMNVITYGREGSAERARADGVPMADSKESLFAEADIMSLHIRLIPQTRGIVTAKDLSLMKPSALLVNTSRAGLIEEGALVAALKAGRPGSAAVDVYEQEPVRGAEHPLLSMENAVCTPHLGYVTRGTFERYFGIAFDQINAFADGEPINIHNPEVLD